VIVDEDDGPPFVLVEALLLERMSDGPMKKPFAPLLPV
jgi:hypothetical protein